MNFENTKALIKVNLRGGSYFDFRLKDLPVNPLNYRTKDSEQLKVMGHYLCFDRWGPPTEAERKNGFGHHGEVNFQEWEILDKSIVNNNLTTCSMRCSLPMGGLQLTRKIELAKDEPAFFVTEDIKNLNTYGRMFNIVQHATIAPPFLDGTTIIDTNAEKGFENRLDGSLDQDRHPFKWPHATHKGARINLRQFQDEWPLVSSFAFRQNDKYGWVTACNPGKRLMLGYLWKIEDYPWINFWRSWECGVQAAFGMEFGTTGLHEPFPVVARKGKIFGRNIYDFIDADEVIQKSFMAFLSRIPEDYKGVGSIKTDAESIFIKERGEASRNIVYPVHKSLV